MARDDLVALLLRRIGVYIEDGRGLGETGHGKEALDELGLVAEFRRCRDRGHDPRRDLLVLYVVAVAPFHQHEDVVDVDLDLADELHLEHQVVGDGLLLGAPAIADLVTDRKVFALVVLHLALGRGVVLFETVEAS